MKNNKIILMWWLSVFLFLWTSAYSQVYNNPSVAYRTNKSIAITSFEILENSVVIDFEYLKSSLYEEGNYICISPATKIITESNQTAKLKGVKNIAIYPKKTLLKNDMRLHKFSLIFENKIDFNNTRFSVVEEEGSTRAFNFYDVNLKNNSKLSKKDQPLSDYFLKHIPYCLHSLYFKELFIHSHFNTQEYFNILIEELYNDKKIQGISKLKIENTILDKKKAISYLIIPPKEAKAVLSEYFYNKSEEGERVKRINIYFRDKIIAKKFFKSISDWYGATISQEGKTALLTDLRNRKNVLFSISEMYNSLHIVSIDVFTLKEFITLSKSL